MDITTHQSIVSDLHARYEKEYTNISDAIAEIESQAREIERLKSHQCQPVCVFHQGDEIKELRAALDDAVSALDIASKFCGSHTAEECSDSVAIPINEALTRCKEVLNG
jgi:hypothetical protein